MNEHTIVQPYKGLWRLSHDGKNVGTVNGDAVIGFTARDGDGHIVGLNYYATSEAAIAALVALKAST